MFIRRIMEAVMDIWVNLSAFSSLYAVVNRSETETQMGAHG